MSDERDDDATPEPDDGSEAAGSAAADPDADATPSASRPSAKRSGTGRPSSGLAGGEKAPEKKKRTAPARPGAKGRATPAREKPSAPVRRNPVARLSRYLREVVAELRKVIWPTRNELITYTIVVLVFVSFMVALTSGLDLVFARGILQVFG
ncbi:MAG: preprotein translocase subunit SecE [Mycobacteriaceae bacterium]